MFTVILVMAAGVATGYVLRRLPLLQRVERTTSLTILLLLFILGLSVGSNRLIVDNLARFGWPWPGWPAACWPPWWWPACG